MPAAAPVQRGGGQPGRTGRAVLRPRRTRVSGRNHATVPPATTLRRGAMRAGFSRPTKWLLTCGMELMGGRTLPRASWTRPRKPRNRALSSRSRWASRRALPPTSWGALSAAPAVLSTASRGAGLSQSWPVKLLKLMGLESVLMLRRQFRSQLAIADFQSMRCYLGIPATVPARERGRARRRPLVQAQDLAGEHLPRARSPIAPLDAALWPSEQTAVRRAWPSTRVLIPDRPGVCAKAGVDT